MIAGFPADTHTMTLLYALGAALVLLVVLRASRAGKERRRHQEAIRIAQLVLDQVAGGMEDRIAANLAARLAPQTTEPPRAGVAAAGAPGARRWGFGGLRGYDARRRHAR